MPIKNPNGFDITEVLLSGTTARNVTTYEQTSSNNDLYWSKKNPANIVSGFIFDGNIDYFNIYFADGTQKVYDGDVSSTRILDSDSNKRDFIPLGQHYNVVKIETSHDYVIEVIE